MENPITFSMPRILLRGTGPHYEASLLDAENNPVPSSEVRFGFASGAIRAGDALCAAAAGAIKAVAEEDNSPLGTALTSVSDREIVTYRILPQEKS